MTVIVVTALSEPLNRRRWRRMTTASCDVMSAWSLGFWCNNIISFPPCVCVCSAPHSTSPAGTHTCRLLFHWEPIHMEPLELSLNLLLPVGDLGAGGLRKPAARTCRQQSEVFGSCLEWPAVVGFHSHIHTQQFVASVAPKVQFVWL